MRKIFISQPMNGKSDRIIREERNRVAFAFALKDKYEIIDSILNLGPQNPIQYLAKNAENGVDVIRFHRIFNEKFNDTVKEWGDG